jgi:hypothetical protein
LFFFLLISLPPSLSLSCHCFSIRLIFEFVFLSGIAIASILICILLLFRCLRLNLLHGRQQSKGRKTRYEF